MSSSKQTHITVGVVVLALVAMGGAGDLHAGVIQQDATFSTTDQGLWSRGAAAVDISKSYFLGPQWDEQSHSAWVGTGVSTSFAAVHLHEGRLGLEAIFNASSGSVDVDYPVRLRYETPDQPVRPGHPIQVKTSYQRRGTPKLDITGFGAEFKVDAVANLKATWGGGHDQVFSDAVYTGNHGGPTSLPFFNVFDSVDPWLYEDDLTLLDTGGERRVTLITIGPGAGVTLKVPGLNTLAISAKVPPPLNQRTMSFLADGDLRTAKTGDPFLSLDLNVTTMASMLVQAFSGGTVPPLNASIEFPGFSSEVGYALLEIMLKSGPALHQDLEFDFRGLEVVLTSADGQVRSGQIGQTFDFVAPADGSDLELTAEVSVDQRFVNKTGLTPQIALTVDVLKANLKVWGLDLINFGPLWKLNPPLTLNFDPIMLYTPEPWELDGFNTQTQAMTIDVIPEPATLSLLAAGAIVLLRHKRRR